MDPQQVLATLYIKVHVISWSEYKLISVIESMEVEVSWFDTGILISNTGSL